MILIDNSPKKQLCEYLSIHNKEERTKELNDYHLNLFDGEAKEFVSRLFKFNWRSINPSIKNVAIKEIEELKNRFHGRIMTVHENKEFEELFQAAKANEDFSIIFNAFVLYHTRK